MGGVNLDLLFRRGLYPAAAGNLAARENERMSLAFIDDGELKIAVEWRARDGFPHY
jgi:hypothetical protein